LFDYFFIIHPYSPKVFLSSIYASFARLIHCLYYYCGSIY
jgi:hypothetical protein